MYSSQSDYVYSKRFAQDITKCYLKGDPGAKGDPGIDGIKGESGTSAFKGEPGTNGTNGTNGDKGEPGIDGISGARTNVAIVDQNGNDSTASVGGLPFLTIQGALSYIQSGQQVQILPGTYTLPSGITIPTGVVLQGSPPCILQMTATSDTTMITIGEDVRLENLTITLDSASHVNLIGILFTGTAASTTSQLANIQLTVTNNGASSTGSSDITGIQCNGTGGLLSSSFAWNAIQSSTIKILSNGGGKKRGILISNSNVVSTRDTNVYVAPPPTTTSTGSYVGIENNDSTNTGGAIQIRSSSIGTTPPSAGQSYTASDILQTTPPTIASPAYLASAGIQIGPGTDLVSKTAGSKGFSTFNYPTILFYGLKGALNAGVAGYLWCGTQQVTNNNFPDPGTPAAYFRIQQPSLLSGLSCKSTIAPGTGHSTIILVRYTPVNGTITDTMFIVTLSNTITEGYFYNGSVALSAGDKLHVYVSYTGNSGNLTHDLTIQLDLF